MKSSDREPASGVHLPHVCPACGGIPRRAMARFCATCGRKLDGTDYLPSDRLRASYHRHHLPHVLQTAQTGLLASNKRFYGPAASAMQAPCQRNNAANMAVVFVAYASIPYLGILFCLCAVVMGIGGLLAAARTPMQSGLLASLFSIAMGLLIYCAQLHLWLSLYESVGSYGF